MMIDMLTPALVAGNTCVLKPASVNSLLAVKLAEILDEVGLPAGAVNLVTGPGSSAGKALPI
jgi:acyl-CoA reductase-like NAD-dependent aldehyde dehydrogenase